jgi:hypothetical protein
VISTFCASVRSRRSHDKRRAWLAYFRAADNQLQEIINGLTLGSIYGLIAIGYTMMRGIIGMMNFVHGEIYMITAFISIIVFLGGFDPRYLCSAHPRFANNDIPYFDLRLDGGACRLPAVARVTEAGPANFGDR